MSQEQTQSNRSDSKRGVSRRHFMAGAGAAAVACSVVEPKLARGYSANEKVDLAIIGCGGRGTWITDLFKQHGGKNYLFAANSANAEVSARFAVGPGARITLPFEGRQIAADERGFADTFGPYAVHVYVWE